ncbi:MAG: MFS transporter [Bryobacteraceae bacterium]|nr:MFS transporter [Bryobacteraceae bacterium]
MGWSPQEFGSRFWAIIAATFLGFLGIGTVLPALGPHVRHDLGGSDQTVGFVIGTFSFIALFSRFLSGPLADRKGRKTAFLAGLVSCGCAGLVYLLPLGIPGAYLGRALQGFGEACLYIGAAAWVVESAGVHRSGQALGYLSSGIWGGISVGPVVGQWLGSFERAAPLQAVCATAAIILLSRVPEVYTPHSASRYGGKWLPSILIPPGIAVGFVNVQYPVVAGFLILHLQRYGKTGPLAFTACASMILLSRFFLGGLPDRIHPAITYYGGITAMAVGLLMIASGPSGGTAVLAGAILGLGFSFPWSAVASTVLRQIPASERGSAVGILKRFLRPLRRNELLHRRNRGQEVWLLGRVLYGSCLPGVRGCGRELRLRFRPAIRPSRRNYSGIGSRDGGLRICGVSISRVCNLAQSR